MEEIPQNYGQDDPGLKVGRLATARASNEALDELKFKPLDESAKKLWEKGVVSSEDMIKAMNQGRKSPLSDKEEQRLQQDVHKWADKESKELVRELKQFDKKHSFNTEDYQEIKKDVLRLRELNTDSGNKFLSLREQNQKQAADQERMAAIPTAKTENLGVNETKSVLESKPEAKKSYADEMKDVTSYKVDITTSGSDKTFSYNVDLSKGKDDPVVAFEAEGKERKFEVHLPPNYDPNKKYPVMLLAQGANIGGADGIMPKLTDMNSYADREGFVIVNLLAINPERNDSSTWGVTSWNGDYTLRADGNKGRINKTYDDIKYVDTVLKAAKNEYNLDMNNICISGMSDGSTLSHEYALRGEHRLAYLAISSGTIIKGMPPLPEDRRPKKGAMFVIPQDDKYMLPEGEKGAGGDGRITYWNVPWKSVQDSNYVFPNLPNAVNSAPDDQPKYYVDRSIQDKGMWLRHDNSGSPDVSHLTWQGYGPMDGYHVDVYKVKGEGHNWGDTDGGIPVLGYVVGPRDTKIDTTAQAIRNWLHPEHL